MNYSPYTLRKHVLRSMGYASYDEYLCSPFWRQIRQSVLANNPICYKCNKAKADNVHHKSYSQMVMKGQNLKELVALCRPCHEKIEYTSGGKKLSLTEANKKLERGKAKITTPSPKGFVHGAKTHLTDEQRIKWAMLPTMGEDGKISYQKRTLHIF